ncbi:SUKH-4 family immunity protein [Streptomyces sp. WMMB 714]|uniref:SUKH-4 family immunity protein n=1 Tax=Streptomyces sp. WMMB 714 TaxID=1286822 RepID=UPI000B1DF1A2|nr:SUKH-4 family immunity protein [Streptomyces sp. WMMB 714]
MDEDDYRESADAVGDEEPVRVDRSMMESVFGAENLNTWPEPKLPEDLRSASREFLMEVGLPDDPASFFLLDDAPLKDEDSSEGLSRCSSLAGFSQYQGMPAEWAKWLVLGEIGVDPVVLDPCSGTVYSLPDGEYRADPLNSSVESFASFLYLLEGRRSEWDPEASEEPIDPRSAVTALRESLEQADPLPFEGHEPGWSESFDQDDDGPRMPTWDFLLRQIYEG